MTAAPVVQAAVSSAPWRFHGNVVPTFCTPHTAHRTVSEKDPNFLYVITNQTTLRSSDRPFIGP